MFEKKKMDGHNQKRRYIEKSEARVYKDQNWQKETEQDWGHLEER